MTSLHPAHQPESSPTNPPAVLTLYVLSKREKIRIAPHSKIVLGRLEEPPSADTFYIDLTPYYAYQLGVSRRHLMLAYDESQQLMAFDLASQNGSFLNGQKLSSHTGYRVQDGDELTVGSLSIRIYYSSTVPFSEEVTPYTHSISVSEYDYHATGTLAYPAPTIRDTLETSPLVRDVLPQDKA